MSPLAVTAAPTIAVKKLNMHGIINSIELTTKNKTVSGRGIRTTSKLKIGNYFEFQNFSIVGQNHLHYATLSPYLPIYRIASMTNKFLLPQAEIFF